MMNPMIVLRIKMHHFAHGLRWLPAALRLKWPVASLTLITLPAIIIYGPPNPSDDFRKALIYLGMLPLFIAIVIELLGGFIIKKEGSDLYKGGSRIGNLFAKCLGLVLLAFVLWIMYSIASQRT